MPDNNNTDNSFRERLASLETSNNHTIQTIREMSASLKEIVKTQHVLANQKEEIIKMVAKVSVVEDNVSAIKEEVYHLSTKNELLELKLKQAEEKLTTSSTNASEAKELANRTSNTLKGAIKVITAVIIPLAVGIIVQFI